MAKDGTKRGRIYFVGNVVNNGKEYTVFVYNRMETIESSEQSSGTYWYWLTYTVDTKTGKVVHQTEYDVDSESGNFLGISDNYAFFSRADGVSAIDLHNDNKIVKPLELNELIGKKTPALKGNIAYMEVDNLNLKVTTKLADIYLLNPNTLTGEKATSKLSENPAYSLKSTLPDYGKSVMINGRISGYVIDDTTTLALEALNENNNHKYYFYTIHHPSRVNFLEMTKGMKHEQSDNTLFLDGNMRGLKDSVVLVESLTALGNTGVKKMSAYDLKNRKFIWSKPVLSLYDHSDNMLYYKLYWNQDGNSFFIHSDENGYTPVSLVNAQTGKIIWKF